MVADSQDRYISKANDGRIPGVLLWQVAKLWQQQLNVSLADIGLSSTNGAILTNILQFHQEGGAATQKAIAAVAKVDVMTTSQAIRTLEQKGFITRQPDPKDKRAYVITLTTTGKTTALQAIERIMAAHKIFFATLEADGKRERFIEDLDEIMVANNVKINGV